MSKVVIAEGKDIVKRTYLALKELKLRMPKKGEKILIKPNLVEPMPNYSGAITRKEVIEGIIQFFDDKKYEILIGEGAAVFDTEKCFEKANYYELEKKYNVKLVNLNKDEFVTVKGNYWDFEISKIAKESYLISTAVLKEHPFEVTLTLKNLMGILKPKGNYPVKSYIHKEGDEKIWAERLCDLIRAAKPKLAIIDATTAMFGSHLFGSLKELNSTLASEDALACDLLGARLLGHEKVFYLDLALKEKLGRRPLEVKKVKLI
ncbi:MAG: DUF362 domain-containing protein [Candidatus Aenigmatarchaeota archaeon]